MSKLFIVLLIISFITFSKAEGQEIDTLQKTQKVINAWDTIKWDNTTDLTGSTVQLITIECKIVDCYNNAEVPYVTIAIQENRNTIRKKVADNKGHFVYKNLDARIPGARKYKLSFNSPGIEPKDTLIVLQNNETNISICIGDIIPEDELLYSTSLAKKDINNKEIRLLRTGMPLESKAMKKLTKRYHFEFKELGNIENSRNVIQSIGNYNAVMIQYLETKNGAGWYERFMASYEEILYNPLEYEIY